jgi:hypothetical protein
MAVAERMSIIRVLDETAGRSEAVGLRPSYGDYIASLGKA